MAVFAAHLPVPCAARARKRVGSLRKVRQSSPLDQPELAPGSAAETFARPPRCPMSKL
jgi:hypothetical protein